ncbi:MAG: hypothetical protein K9L26_04595 [Candidatus Izimaplasma sp.]|nr:hypothetical protein [Candidatus Izimaplasma bacterium]
MRNIVKHLMLITLVFGVVFITVSASAEPHDISQISNENYPFIEDAKFSSSRYTTMADDRLITNEMIIPITDSDELIEENSQFRLYYDDTRISFKVENKMTGYVWATHIDAPDQGSFDGLLQSGIAIEYIDLNRNRQLKANVGITETIHQVERTSIAGGIRLSINFGGFCSTRTCERLYPDYLEGQYTEEEMAEFGLDAINVSLDLEVTLSDTGLKAHVPYESIVEGNKENVMLSSIILFPSLGATRMDDVPGYMVIPDGAGTLIRYEDNEGQFLSPYEERFYGENLGIEPLKQSVSNYPLSMPIFGAVHGVNQNGFVGIIESGDVNARLFAYPNGASNLDYNLIFTKIDYAQVYLQSFNRAGTGGAMREVKTSASDITIDYRFLDQEESTYVGIGKTYRDYLESNGIIEKLNRAQTQIDLLVDYLMADNENSFFGDSLVPMTSTEEVRKMYDYFITEGINQQLVGLMGWNKGGYSGYLPSDVSFENALGSDRDFRELIDYVNENNQVLLMNDYVFATEDTKAISFRRHVAEGVNQFKLEDMCHNCVHNSEYVLYPEISNRLAMNDYEDYVDLNVNVTFRHIANTLLSYDKGGLYLREDALALYLEILETYQDIGYYHYPQAYAYQYTNGFFDVPLYNSQLKYFDDLVPLLQIVLKGYIPMYSPYLDYNSLGQEQILALIDFGVYPAYILTEEPSSLLKDTDVSRFFTTEFNLWQETVVATYHQIDDALSQVINASIVGRDVLALGVVKVTYDNGVVIYINYTSDVFSNSEVTIPETDYLVMGGDAS